jgi:hypothetical protein
VLLRQERAAAEARGAAKHGMAAATAAAIRMIGIISYPALEAPA